MRRDKSYSDRYQLLGRTLGGRSLKIIFQLKPDNIVRIVDLMNVGLAKAGVYNALMQKRIVALLEMRNKAAHGDWSKFNEVDVGRMIAQIRTYERLFRSKEQSTTLTLEAE